MTAWTGAAREALRLLDRQRRCLREGRRDRLPGLLRALARTLAKLESMSPDPGGEALLERLREEAARNAGIARARLDGARKARERLRKLHEGAEVGAYAPSGMKLAPAAPAATRDQRA